MGLVIHRKLPIYKSLINRRRRAPRSVRRLISAQNPAAKLKTAIRLLILRRRRVSKKTDGTANSADFQFETK